jgi:hypothetical protein
MKSFDCKSPPEGGMRVTAATAVEDSSLYISVPHIPGNGWEEQRLSRYHYLSRSIPGAGLVRTQKAFFSLKQNLMSRIGLGVSYRIAGQPGLC